MGLRKSFTAGQKIWVVERDCREAVGVSPVMVLAELEECVFATENDWELDEAIECHIQETANNTDTRLFVFPTKDCYSTKEDAKTALKNEVS